MSGSEELLMTTGNRFPLGACRKIYIQRDYSQGLAVKFVSVVPAELEGKVEPALVEATVARLNAMYAEGEKVGARSAAETLLGCATCYLAFLCLSLQYDRSLRRIADFLRQQNETLFLPRGLFLTDPIERGLRVLEISVLTEPAPVAAAPLPGMAGGVPAPPLGGPQRPYPRQQT